MTANQISWWNIQENIRSHQQNELNERNKQAITQTLGDEQNRISNTKVSNDFILGQQGNSINKMQAETAARRATQDYEIGKGTLSNAATRNAQDFEIGKGSNANKAKEVANNYVLGRAGLEIQSTRNAQDYAIGQLQQNSNSRQADAALLNAGAQIGKLNPAQIVVALAAPTAQQAVNAGVKKVAQAMTQQKVTQPVSKVSASPQNKNPLTTGQKNVISSPRMTGGPKVAPKPVTKPATKTSKTKPSSPASNYRR